MPNGATPNSHLCFIIHANRPYCFDLNDILALPSGLRYRNRFDVQWVQPDLRDSIESLVGQRVLLTLRDPANNRLVPVRWGRLITAERYGRITFFEYLLGDLVEYGNDENVQVQQIVSHTDTFRSNHSWLPGVAHQSLSDPSVFRTTVGTGMPTVEASDRQAWGNVVSAVAQAQIFHRVEFLKIMGIFSAEDRPVAIKDEAFMLSPDSVYSLKIIQYVPTPGPPGQDSIPPHPIEITTFSDHIIALRSKQQAVGKYDRLTFALRVRSLPSGERTAMEVPHVPDAANGGTYMTSLYLPIKIGRVESLRAAASIVLLLACVYLMFRPNIFALSPDIVRNVATVLFVLTLSGPSRTIAAAWPSLPWRVDR
jgi:hypothetical protein